MTGGRATARVRTTAPARSLQGHWRLVVGDGTGLAPADGATNMGIDVALLEGVRRGAGPALRFYRWAPPCLSFGRNQPARDLYDLRAASARGIDFVRRPTGGQAVLHADELTYAVVAPVALIGRPREAYRRINEALVLGLNALGIPAELAVVRARAAGPSAREWGMACFRRPEAGEVVASGRKLVGSAQRVEGRVILQHGSLLLGGSQAGAEELLRTAGATAGAAVERPTGWTTLEAELGARPETPALVAALTAGFERVLGTSLARGTLTDPEVAEAGRLKERYGSAAWTWRR
jgi:lipoyl(octanoyl) transferase